MISDMTVFPCGSAQTHPGTSMPSEDGHIIRATADARSSAGRRRRSATGCGRQLAATVSLHLGDEGRGHASKRAQIGCLSRAFGLHFHGIDRHEFIEPRSVDHSLCARKIG